MINDIEEFKKDPSIVFEYKYFSTDGSTKYFDKVSDPNAPEQSANGDELPEARAMRITIFMMRMRTTRMR